MKVAVLDDWFDTLRHLPCFGHLDGMDVTVFTDHVSDQAKLAQRLAGFEAVTLFRERTAVTAELLAQLPNLRLISQRSVYPHVDVDACTRHGVLFCSNMAGGTPPHAAAEHTWALILAAMRQLPQQMDSLRQGKWQIGVGKTLHGRTLGLYGYGRIAKRVAGFAKAFGMKVIWWGSDDGRARALADGQLVAKSREAFFAEPDVVSVHVRLKPETRGLITAQDLSAMLDIHTQHFPSQGRDQVQARCTLVAIDKDHVLQVVGRAIKLRARLSVQIGNTAGTGRHNWFPVVVFIAHAWIT